MCKILLKVTAFSLMTVAIGILWECRDQIKTFLKPPPPEKLFTESELEFYNGKDRRELYLSVLGNVFDVTKGAKHYGPDQKYNIFVGRDASRIFVSGFLYEDAISDDILDFDSQELRSINNWLKFYNKEYTRIGKLIGRYFENNGKMTLYGRAIKARIEKAEPANEEDNSMDVKFPRCRLFPDSSGVGVWCQNKSGSKNFAGVPRKLYIPGYKYQQCVCITKDNERLGQITEYVGCSKGATGCYVERDDFYF